MLHRALLWCAAVVLVSGCVLTRGAGKHDVGVGLATSQTEEPFETLPVSFDVAGCVLTLEQAAMMRTHTAFETLGWYGVVVFVVENRTGTAVPLNAFTYQVELEGQSGRRRVDSGAAPVANTGWRLPLEGGPTRPFVLDPGQRARVRYQLPMHQAQSEREADPLVAVHHGGVRYPLR